MILVGEMRDLETIEAAITAAETGHVVFGTLHTNSAQGTVNRIIDAFPGNLQDQIRTQLSTSLIGVVAQTLLPRIGGGRIAAFEIAGGHARRRQPDSRKQNVPDQLGHPDRGQIRHDVEWTTACSTCGWTKKSATGRRAGQSPRSRFIGQTDRATAKQQMDDGLYYDDDDDDDEDDED